MQMLLIILALIVCVAAFVMALVYPAQSFQILLCSVFFTTVLAMISSGLRKK